MKIVIHRKEPREKIKINKQLLATIVFFVLFSILIYLLVTSLNAAAQQSKIASLNQAAAAYGDQLTQEFSVNSSACQQADLNATLAKVSICGAVYYCYYSSACQYQKPAQTNSLSIMCDILEPNKVVATGICFKQAT
jgi:type II secretory pathway pseudopilin PulG